MTELVKEELSKFKLDMDENQENLYQDFLTIKRNTVDEVLKEVELKNYPLTSEIEQAITNIISGRLDRSLSAPSRIGVKVYNNLTLNHD